MRPGLFFVCDPLAGKAAAILDRLLAELPEAAGAHVEMDLGADWAVAVLAAPAQEPTCGAHVCSTQDDLLIWAGEMFVPDAWPRSSGSDKRETISRALIEHLRSEGVEAIGEIDGGFCGAWYDRNEARWFIFNDRMGQIPIFWSAHGDRLVVSPRAWLTWRGIGTSLQISSQGVADLIRTQNMTEDHTLIEGVHWLPRGHGLSYGPEAVGGVRYWGLDYQRDQIEKEEEALDLYLECITATLRRHCSAQSELLLGVSGGLDSRIFLAVCEQIGRVPRCFTSGWPFYEDVRFGRKLARVAGAAHDLLPLIDEGLPQRLESAIVDSDGQQSAAHLSPLLPIRGYLQRHHGAVLLEGFFHGLVGGCAVPSERDVLSDRPPYEQNWARATLHSGGDFDMIDGLLQPAFARDSRDEWQSRIERVYRSAPARDGVSRAEYTMVHGRMGRVDVLGTGLLRSDVLVRNPASDLLMLDWHQRVSPCLRRGRSIYLSALRRAFPNYARVPRADGCGALPIITDRWLREYCWQVDRVHRSYAWVRYPVTRRWGTSSRALRAWAFDVWRRSGRLEILRDPSARVLNWVRREALLELWDRAENHALQAEPLLTLATLEVMCRWLEVKGREPLATERAGSLFRQREPRMRIPAGSAG